MPDLPDWSQSVSIDAASVTIPISGSISITSGTVTIANASIAVINATGTKITSARPPTKFQEVRAFNQTVTQTSNTLPADVQALLIVLPDALSGYAHFKYSWTPAGGTQNWVPIELFSFQQQVYVIPIAPSTTDGSGNIQNTLDLLLQTNGATVAAVDVYALYESSPLWMQVFPLPQLEPNQIPFFIDPGQIPKLQVGSVAFALIAAVANVQISLFEVALQYAIYGAAHVSPGFIIGHSATLPTFAAQPTQAQTLIRRISADSSLYTYLFHGAQLPRGDGLWVFNNDTGDVLDVGVTINYSLG